MKSHFKKLLKGVIVSSMATLANTYGAEAMPTYRFSDNPPDDVSDEYDRSSKNESVKMLLHLNSDDTYYFGRTSESQLTSQPQFAPVT